MHPFFLDPVRRLVGDRRWPGRLALPVLVASIAACGGDDGGTAPTGETPTTDALVFERLRDGTTGNIVPALTESGTGFDAREVDSACVVFDPTRTDSYLLFYEASDAANLSRIGVVTSASEDFASLGVGRTTVVDLGGAGSGYENGATDPCVLIQSTGPRYRMWFEGLSNGGATSRILTATSDDGVSWTVVAACNGLDPTYAGERVADPAVVFDGGVYRMWFEAVGGVAGLGAIGYAESSDGVDWTLKDATGATGAAASPVLMARGGTAFDAAGVHAPCVNIDPSEASGSAFRWLLWYEASNTAASTENTIGLATSSDGLNWARLDAPVLAPSSDSIVPLPFDSGDLEHPTVLVDDANMRDDSGHYLLYYSGDGEANATPNRIGVARGQFRPETMP